MPAGESGTAYSHSPHNASETRHFDHPHKVMLGLYIGAFLGMLSETSMNIALPDLMDEFSVSSGTAQWMVVGYMLAIGVVLPCVGFMLKWIKAKTLVLFALTCFLVGALVCTVATGFPVLLAGRIVQGISTGIVLPTMYAAIMRVFPPHKIGAANGVAGLVIMFAPVIGPTLAGALIGALSWRAIFALFAVVAVIALACTAAFFVTPIERTRPAVDMLSIVASALGFGCLVAGVSLISDMGFSVAVVGLLVIGVVVLALYAYRQLHIADPLLDLRAWHCGVPYAGHHGQLLVCLHFGVHVFGAAGIAARTGHELYARRSAHAARRHRQRGVHADGRSPVRPSWCEGARVDRCGDGSHRWRVVLCHRC